MRAGRSEAHFKHGPQVHIGKSTASQGSFSCNGKYVRLEKEYLKIAFTQEPYSVTDQIKALTGELTYCSSNGENPRACLFGEETCSRRLGHLL